MGVVHAEIEHLLKESNKINSGYFVFANTSILLCWKHYIFMGRKCLRNEITWISYVMFDFCIDCAYLSVNSVNGKGEKSNFTSQLREYCNMRHPFHTTCLSAVNIRLLISCDTDIYAINHIILHSLTFEIRSKLYLQKLVLFKLKK